jgi:hypothetical protein
MSANRKSANSWAHSAIANLNIPSIFFHIPYRFSSRFSAVCLQCHLPPSQAVFIQILCSVPAVPSSTFPSGFHPNSLQCACSAFFHLPKRFLSRYSAACLQCLHPPSQAFLSRYSAACLRCLLSPSQGVIQILCSMPAVHSSIFPSNFHPDSLQFACSACCAFFHLPKRFSSRYSAACLQCLLPPSQVVFIQILCSVPAVPSFTFPSGLHSDTLQRACSAFFHLPKRFPFRYTAACLRCLLLPSQAVFIQILCSMPAVHSSTFPSGFHPDTLQRACSAFFHLPKRFSSRYSAACLCWNF